MTVDTFRANEPNVFSSSSCGCSVSTVKNPFPLANLYRLQPIATDSIKSMYSVSTVRTARTTSDIAFTYSCFNSALYTFAHCVAVVVFLMGVFSHQECIRMLHLNNIITYQYRYPVHLKIHWKKHTVSSQDASTPRYQVTRNIFYWYGQLVGHQPLVV